MTHQIPPNQRAALFSGERLAPPLAAIFGGLAAAGQPGGWGNFGVGAQQGTQNFQQGQNQQQLMQLRQQQMQMQEEEMRRAESERAAEEARLKGIQDFLGGGGGVQTASAVQPVGNYGAATGGAPQQGQSAILGGMTPQQSALFSQYAQVAPEQAFQMLVERGFAEPDKAKLPSEVQEYEYAKQQGYQGTFFDYQNDLKKAGASSTKVDVHAPNQPMLGPIPPGHVVTPVEGGGWTMGPVPGSPAAVEAAAAAAAGEVKTEKEQKTGNIVVQDIDRALDLAEDSPFWTTGFVGQALSGFGGTAAHDLKGLTDTIRANAGFAELQAMRDSSPTGGALGQVTERELAFLQATIGNLEQSQSPDQFKDNLRRVKNVYLDIIHGEGGPQREKMTFEGGAPDLKSKYGLE